MMQENRKLLQKVEKLEKLLNLTAQQKVNAMLGMGEIATLHHQVSVYSVPRIYLPYNPGFYLPHRTQLVGPLMLHSQVYLGVFAVVPLIADPSPLIYP